MSYHFGRLNFAKGVLASRQANAYYQNVKFGGHCQLHISLPVKIIFTGNKVKKLTQAKTRRGICLSGAKLRKSVSVLIVNFIRSVFESESQHACTDARYKSYSVRRCTVGRSV